jgi:hypothetical protein
MCVQKTVKMTDAHYLLFRFVFVIFMIASPATIFST